jgi:hypothetical protein
MSVKPRVAIAALVYTLVTSPIARADTGNVPSAAAAIINRVRQAAEQRDWTTLRKLLVRDFTWSFGGDRDADQAIDSWKDDPRYLRELVRVLGQGCRGDATQNRSGIDAARVKCPGSGDLSFRAGFIETREGWRLEYFVEGD